MGQPQTCYEARTGLDTDFQAPCPKCWKHQVPTSAVLVPPDAVKRREG